MSQQINLFNPVFEKQHKLFSLLTMLEALVMIVAGSLLFYGYAFYQVDQLGRQLEESAKRYDMNQVRMAGYIAEFSPQQAGQSLQDEVKRLEKQVADQAELINVIKSGAMGNTTGYSEYMRAFARQVEQGLWLTGFKITSDAAQISLSGAATEPGLLPAYIQRLGKEDIMRGKTFANLQIRQQKVGAGPGTTPRYVEFTLHSGPDSEARK